MLGDCLWHIYALTGKLTRRLLVSRARRWMARGRAGG